MKQDNAAGGSTQAAPAHIVVVTKGDANALSSRVTAFQAVSEWAQAKGVPCIAACPTLTARTSARFSVAGVVAVSVCCGLPRPHPLWYVTATRTRRAHPVVEAWPVVAVGGQDMGSVMDTIAAAALARTLAAKAAASMGGAVASRAASAGATRFRMLARKARGGGQG